MYALVVSNIPSLLIICYIILLFNIKQKEFSKFDTTDFSVYTQSRCDKRGTCTLAQKYLIVCASNKVGKYELEKKGHQTEKKNKNKTAYNRVR